MVARVPGSAGSFVFAVACVLVLLSFSSIPSVGAQSPANSTSYSFPIGYTQCYSCDAGTFIGSEGSGQCQACQAGYFQSSPGSSACDECPMGM